MLRKLPTLTKQQAGSAVSAHVKTWLDETLAQRNLSVGLFKSLSDEIATDHLDSMLQTRGARRAVACMDATAALPFYPLAPHESITKHDANAFFAPNELDLDVIFMPGLAFDQNGNRLGRGRGFFDQSLAPLATWPKRPILVGLLLDEQLVPEEIPHASHDIVVDYLCTPKRGMIKLASRDNHA